MALAQRTSSTAARTHTRSPFARLGEYALPGFAALIWLAVVLIPIA